MPSEPLSDSAMSPAERAVSEAIGRLIEFWGFKRHMGRVWAVLHLSDQPLTSRDLRERLSLSTGSVSMTLTELQRWGVVRRVVVEGSRAEHFTAENNLWKMVSRVLRERELVEIQEAITRFEAGLLELENETPKSDEERARRAIQKARVEELLEVARLGRSLLEALVSTARVDATALAKLFLGSERPDA
jgi:DNA-binding transcriptional regulator GbsR (MarR family)